MVSAWQRRLRRRDLKRRGASPRFYRCFAAAVNVYYACQGAPQKGRGKTTCGGGFSFV